VSQLKDHINQNIIDINKKAPQMRGFFYRHHS
jgi:hypothetical protein